MPGSPQHKAPDDFLTGPILPTLLRFALPLMLSLLLQALYGGVDLAVVGRFSSAASSAAVATGSQFMLSATCIITGLTMGVTVLVGKAIGGRDPEAAGCVVAGQIFLFSAVAVILTAVMVGLAPQAARLLQVPAAALPEAVSYIRICSGGMVFITAYNTISGIFRGIGNSRSPFLFVLIACMVNVFLDLLLVGVFHLSAAGAAMATVISQAASVAFSAVYMWRHPLPFPVTRESFRQKKVAICAILRVGSPIAAQDLLVNISFLMITGFVNALGVAEANSVGISEKLFSLLAIVPMAFMSALSAFVAQNIGGGKPERALRSLWLAMGVSCAIGVLVFLMNFFAGAVPASLFSKSPEVIAASVRYLKGSSFEYLLAPAIFCFLGYFNGRERTALVMLQGVLSSLLIRVPLSYLFSRAAKPSLLLISTAVPISSLASLLLCLFCFWRLRRQDRRQKEEIPC